jgi:aminomethyltransferase
VSLVDESDATALIAIQGPRSEPFLSGLCDRDLSGLRYYGAQSAAVAGIGVLLSRTGYTGEDGFELYVAAGQAAGLWDRLLEAGREPGLTPVGLAARDTLRFEMGYCLYGNDIDETTTPLEAGLGWTVKLDKGEFTGREALIRQKETGIGRRLVGLEPAEARAIPRSGFRIRAGGGEGRVTSGTFAPSLKTGYAMGYVPAGSAKQGSEVGIEIRSRTVPARVTRPPFYDKGSRKTQ